MFFPFFVPSIKFVSNKDPSAELYVEYDNLEDELKKEERVQGPDLQVPNTKVVPENEDKRKTHKKMLKRKLFSVKMFGDKYNIGLFTAMYYFYTAPITKFWFYTVRTCLNYSSKCSHAFFLIFFVSSVSSFRHIWLDIAKGLSI